MWEMKLPVHLQFPKGAERGESKGPSPRGNSMSSKKSKKDEEQRVEESARAQLCHPRQIHRKATSC